MTEAAEEPPEDEASPRQPEAAAGLESADELAPDAPYDEAVVEPTASSWGASSASFSVTSALPPLAVRAVSTSKAPSALRDVRAWFRGSCWLCCRWVCMSWLCGRGFSRCLCRWLLGRLCFWQARARPRENHGLHQSHLSSTMNGKQQDSCVTRAGGLPQFEQNNALRSHAGAPRRRAGPGNCGCACRLSSEAGEEAC